QASPWELGKEEGRRRGLVLERGRPPPLLHPRSLRKRQRTGALQNPAGGRTFMASRRDAPHFNFSSFGTASRIFRVISSLGTPSLWAEKFGMMRWRKTGRAAAATSSQLT